jgi:excinuclease UvrABC helicase subunit UvrB
MVYEMYLSLVFRIPQTKPVTLYRFFKDDFLLVCGEEKNVANYSAPLDVKYFNI